MRACLFALALVSAAPAHAEWYQASSEHFLIYSEQKPNTLREFAENLEKFDGAVRAVRGMDDLPPSQGNRITIFMLRDPESVARLAGDKTGYTAGFYKGRASGSIAFASRITQTTVRQASSVPSRLGGREVKIGAGTDTILLHEYAHHLMMQAIATPYPEWLIEGFAEFMSTAQFERDGSVGLGLPALHRYAGLLQGDQLPLEAILSGRYDKITVEQRESIYGRGWLLAHYLTFEPSRKGQLGVYLKALAQGTDSLAAARQAFGDLDKLERDLNQYLRRTSLQYLKIAGREVTFAPVQVTRLTAGGEAILPLLMRVKNGVPASQAEMLAGQVRGVQARFPGDPLVETTLAEAELDAGKPELAQAAAERALKANPRNTDALVLKGRAIAARAEKASGQTRHALFEEARRIFIAANKLDTEDPEPLTEFYHSYAQEGIRPTANAIAALHYASDLAPQDAGLRMTSAMQYLSEGKLADGRRALAVIAYDPHGGEFAQLARQIVAKVDAGDLAGALATARSGSD